VKGVLKLHTRPLILLDSMPLVKMNSVAVAFDDSHQVCKSIFQLIALFRHTIHSISLNVYGKNIECSKMTEYIRSKHLTSNTLTMKKSKHIVSPFVEIISENPLMGMGTTDYFPMEFIESSVISIDEHNEEDFFNSLNNGSICVMGMLSHSTIFEHILGNLGIKLLTHITIPIFIG